MRLSDCFMELFVYMAYFVRSLKTGQPGFDQVQADIQRLISESENIFRKSGFSEEDYDLARFAVFAWIDETILSSGWEQKNRWQGVQLQLIYYKTADAGEQFFERLNTIGLHQRDVREVYYLCLALGFAGRYCQPGDEFLLEQLKTSNLKLLTGSSVGVPTLESSELFPEAYATVMSDDAVATAAGPRFSALTLLSIGIPVLLFGALFWIYRFILTNVGENLIKTVS